MSRQHLLTGGAIATLCLLSALPLHAGAAGQEGMVVARDPQTGKLRAATPEEIKALQAATPASRATAPTNRATAQGPAVLVGPNGARGVRLGEQKLVYEVARRGPDGKLTSECVDGADAANAAVAGTAQAHHQENVREER